MLGTTNISISLVRNTLGESSNSVGGLCKSPRINMWAKYKPVKFTSDSTDGEPNWWKANAENCGIKYTVYNSIRDMIFAAEQGEVAWQYEQPIGTATEPFRLGDFRGYNHNAPPVCTFNPIPPTITVSKPDQTTIVTMGISGGQDNSLTLNDIGGTVNFQNMYFCCGIRNMSDGTTYELDWAHSPLTLANNGITAEIPVGKYPDKRVILYYFLSTETRADYENGRATKFVPLPFPTRELIIEQGVVKITGTATWANNTVTWKFHFDNNAGEVEYTDNRIMLRYGNKQFDEEPWESSEIDTPYRNFTVYPGTYEISGRTGALTLFNSRGGKAFFYARGQEVKGEIPITKG